ncbi:MAG: DUF3455 domain-containing protein [Planctomycetes bacterium]|nr:DUF3455 domain-containing protein [Planctomycetota bacterium]
MKRYILLILAVTASSAAAVLQETAIEKEVKRLAIPESLTPKGKQPLFMVRADGVQSYKADAKLDWVFQEPQATLRDYRTGEEVGTHAKGPIWVDAKRSKLIGKLIGNEPAPNPDAIDWLLLEGKNENGGLYAKVSHIQRADTWAGKMPSMKPTMAGQVANVPYQATYIFWGEP